MPILKQRWCRVGWLKSQLFWKITGLYALLSLLALTGLLVTLTTRMSGQAMARQQQDVLGTLDQIHNELKAGADPDLVIASWQRMLWRNGQRLWLLDRAGRTRTPVEEIDAPPAEITLQSVVQSAIRSGSAMRRIRMGKEKQESLAFALDVSVDPKSPQILLTVIDAGLSDQTVTATNFAIVHSAVFTWIIGLICIAFVVAGLVGPLQAMSLNLHQSTERVQREDMLLTISDRHDELGQVATSLHLLEEEREERISELQLAERTARSSADLMRAVLDSMIEGVIAIDLEQRIVFLNSGVRRLLGISNAIGVGHRLYEAVRVPAFLETVRETIVSGTMQTLEYRAAREQLDLVLVVIPIMKGSHPGAVAVVRDISEIRKIEAMRRDFVSGVSHELKTPLTVIQACTDTLLEGAMADPVAAERFLKQIEEQSERLLQLILGMLQLARVESGQQMLHIEPIDVVTVTDEILRGFRTLAEKKSVKLQFHGPDEMIVSADEQALQTILSNLIDNALKHTNPGGSVTVQLMADPGVPAEYGPSIVVRDTGVGIPEELLGRIFERFYRVERDRSRERGGSGLGLAIVKHLCQALGATVSVKSEVGQGSEFHVQFRKN